MKEDMDIDEELRIRYDTAKQVMALVDSFFESVEFYKKKACEVMMNELGDHNAQEYLFRFLKSEAWNVLEHLKLLCKVKEESLLRLTDDKPYDKYLKELTFSDRTQALLLVGATEEGVKAFLEITQEILGFLYIYQESRFDGESKEHQDSFGKLKQRYKNSHPSKLEYWIDDIFDYQLAVRELRSEYKNDKAVSIWHDCGRDVMKTINTMYAEGCIELDLLSLLQFTVKYDMLQVRMKEVESELQQKVNIGHYHASGSLNIEKIENVDKLSKELMNDE